MPRCRDRAPDPARRRLAPASARSASSSSAAARDGQRRLLRLARSAIACQFLAVGRAEQRAASPGSGSSPASSTAGSRLIRIRAPWFAAAHGRDRSGESRRIAAVALHGEPVQAPGRCRHSRLCTAATAAATAATDRPSGCVSRTRTKRPGGVIEGLFVAEEHRLVADLDLRARRALSVTSRMGGAAAASSWALAASLTYGQAASSACLAASFMAKARQVGKPHSLQLVCGSSL